MAMSDKLLLIYDSVNAIRAALTKTGVKSAGLVGLQDLAPTIELENKGTIVWSKPMDWRELPVVPNSVVGSYLLDENNTVNNTIGFEIEVTGSAIIEWGDTTNSVIEGSGRVTHTYNYNDLPSSSLTEKGFRQTNVFIVPIDDSVITVLNPIIKLDQENESGLILGGLTEIVISLEGLTRISTDFTNVASLRIFTIKGMQGIESIADMLSENNYIKLVTIEGLSNLSNISGAVDSSWVQSLKIIDCPNITTVDNLAYSADHLIELEICDLPNLVTADSMARGCKVLRSLLIGATPKLESVPSMINACESLDEFIATDFSGVTDIYSFAKDSGCSRIDLGELPLLTDTSSAFKDMPHLTDCSLVAPLLTSCTSMFSGSPLIREIDLSWGSELTNMDYLVDGCTSVTKVTLPMVADNSPEYTFRDTPALTELIIEGVSPTCEYVNLSEITNLTLKSLRGVIDAIVNSPDIGSGTLGKDGVLAVNELTSEDYDKLESVRWE